MNDSQQLAQQVSDWQSDLRATAEKLRQGAQQWEEEGTGYALVEASVVMGIAKHIDQIADGLDGPAQDPERKQESDTDM